MRVPWSKSKPLQLDLLSPAPVADKDSDLTAVVGHESNQTATTSISAGQLLIVPTTSLFEDPNNPRTEFPEAELEELAEDIRQHGILQPIVVHPVDAMGRHQIHFGGKEAMLDLTDQWRLGGSRIPEKSKRREAFNIMLSMPRGTDPLIVQRAAREFAQSELADHRYVMVLHDHRPTRMCT